MIVIITPYGRNEVTAAALRLADLIVQRGQSVRVVATLRERHVHPQWDGAVLSAKGRGLYRAATKADVAVYFDSRPEHVKAVRLVAPKARHILIPCSGHGALRAGAFEFFKGFDHIVCPSRALQEYVTGFLYKKPKHEAVSQVSWDSGLPPLARGESRQRLCWHCDYTTIDYFGPMVLQVIEGLLEQFPKALITLASVKSWPRRERVRIRNLAAAAEGRFRVEPCGDLIEQACRFGDHDWVAIPSAKATFGITASRAQTCGAGVIAHDVPPFSELIEDAVSGLLVPCELLTSDAGLLPAALGALGEWVRICAGALSGKPPLGKMRRGEWGLAKRRLLFEEYWSALLGL